MTNPGNSANTAAVTASATRHLLVVDADRKTADLVRTVIEDGMQVRQATSIDAAQAEMLRQPAEVVLVNLQIGDHGGIELIKTLKRRYGNTDIVALSRSRRGEACLDAFHAGASDMLLAPYAACDIQQILIAAAVRRQDMQRRMQRHERLRGTCRRLNKARHEISQQVDILCNDLVRAYQDMAQQLNLTQNAAEFAQLLAGELDVEGVLRRTMEWLLKKLGPVNAAIFLPNGEEQFALGAYLNLDTKADAPLIETLGHTIVGQARGATALSLEEDAIIEELFGEEGHPLKGRQWLAIGCNTPRECLGVLVIFCGKAAGCGKTAGGLGGTTDLNGQARGLIEAAAPILAERIENALGLYQRLHPFEGDETEV
jgi:DNA-binding response OmpR family regulator